MIQASESAPGSERDGVGRRHSSDISQENMLVNEASYGESSILSIVYSLVDEIIKLRIWQTSFFLLRFVTYFQILSVMLWPYANGQWCSDESGGVCLFVRGFAAIGYFSMGGEFKNPIFWGVSLLYLVMFAFLLFCLWFYKRNSRFPTAFVYIASFLLQNLCYIFYIPCCVTMSTSFAILESPGAFNVFAFVVMVIVTCLASWLLHSSAGVLHYCSNPSKGPFASFDGLHVRYAMLVFGTTQAIAGIGSLIDRWFTIVVMALNCLFLIHLMWQLLLFPFVKTVWNVLAGCLYCFSFASNICVIIQPQDDLIRVVSLFGVFIVSGIFWALWFRFMGKKVKQVLDDVGTIFDDSREQALDDMNVSSEWKGLLYTRMGFSRNCLVVYNGIFTLDLCDRVDSPEIAYIAVSILSFFPLERENFMKGISAMKRFGARNFVEKLKINRLLRMEQLRYGTGSTEMSRLLMDLTNKTNDAIAIIKRFWADVADGRSNNLNVFSQLALMSTHLKGKWKELLVAYPNEFKLANEYSRYLAECEGRFTKAMYWELKSEHLEHGLSSVLDDLFRVFAITNPTAIQTGVVEKTGKLAENIPSTDRHTSTTTSGSGTASRRFHTDDKFLEDIEKGRMDELLEKEFEWPKLRALLERATKWSPSRMVNILLIWKYGFYVVMVLLCIVMAVFWHSIGASFERRYDGIRGLNLLRMALGYSRAVVIFNWANETDHVLPQRTVIDDSAIGADFRESLTLWSRRGLEDYVAMFQALAYGSIDNSENVTRFSDMMTAMSLNRVFCFDKWGIAVRRQLSSPKQTMISVLWIQTGFTNFVNLSQNVWFCQYSSLFSEFCPSLTNLSLSFAQDVEDNVNLQRFTVINLTIVFFGVWIILVIPISVAPEAMLRKEAVRLCEAAKSVDQKDAIQASMMLAKGRKNCVTFTNQPRQRAFDIRRWGWFAVAVILTLMIWFIVASCCAASLGLVSYCRNCLLLAHYGTSRLGMVSEMLALLAYYVHSYLRTDMMYHYPPFTKEEFENTTRYLEEYTRLFLSLTDDKELQDLHIVDDCGTTVRSIPDRDFAGCLGLQRAISTYILYGNTVIENVEKERLDSKEFGFFMDLAVGKLHKDLQKSDQLVSALLKTHIQQHRAFIIGMFLLCCGLLLLMLTRDVLYIDLLMKTIKAGYLLLRHLPPACVVDTPRLKNEMVPEQPQEEKSSVIQEAVFNGISQPTLCLGEGNIIEMVNDSFTRAFSVTKSQIIGHELTYFIPESKENGQQRNREECEEMDFYEQLALVWENRVEEDVFLSRVPCITDWGTSEIDIEAHLVRNKFTLNVLGIVFFIEDIKRARDAEVALTNAKTYHETLQNQLIPRPMRDLVTKDITEFGFVAENVFVIAIRLGNMWPSDGQWGNLPDVILMVEELCKANPPFQFLNSYWDIIVIIGGLFEPSPREKLADVCEHLVAKIKYQLNEKLPHGANGGCRYVICVAEGGPAWVGLKDEEHPKFTVTSSIINDVVEAAALYNDEENTHVVTPS